MKIALTGATGLVGRFISAGLGDVGHQVVTLGRKGADIPFDLDGTPPALSGFDGLVHAGFAHVPGRYRGGEGDDPTGFVARNRDGSIRLFQQAVSDGVARIVFLSSRAVYGDYPPGTELTETLPPRPDTLYGQVKWDAEQALRNTPGGVSLRATGVYGPGAGHKWEGLFADFRAGRSIAPRVATEVHGADLAQAVLIALNHDTPCLNVSDLVLDRHDLLAHVAALTGCQHPLPSRANATQVNVMDCTRLHGLGWQPRGMQQLQSSLSQMI